LTFDVGRACQSPVHMANEGSSYKHLQLEYTTTMLMGYISHIYGIICSNFVQTENVESASAQCRKSRFPYLCSRHYMPLNASS
jgi:hypothetical protein